MSGWFCPEYLSDLRGSLVWPLLDLVHILILVMVHMCRLVVVHFGGCVTQVQMKYIAIFPSSFPNDLESKSVFETESD